MTTKTGRTGRREGPAGSLPSPDAVPLVAATLAGLLLGGLAPLGELVTGGGITAVELLSDPAEMTDVAWYTGGVASLNMFLWAGGAALLLTAAAGLRRTEGRLATALACLGVLTVLILLDDRFLLHELVLPHFGVPEIVSYLGYALVGTALLVLLGRTLLAHRESWLLALALAAMALSLLLDLSGVDRDVRRVAEEMAKMVGAAALLAFPAVLVARRLAGDGDRRR